MHSFRAFEGGFTSREEGQEGAMPARLLTFAVCQSDHGRFSASFQLDLKHIHTAPEHIDGRPTAVARDGDFHMPARAYDGVFWADSPELARCKPRFRVPDAGSLHPMTVANRENSLTLNESLRSTVQCDRFLALA